MPPPDRPARGAAGVIRLWFRCPQCSKAFCGLEKIKLGPGRYRYRAPGTKTWGDVRPEVPACPHCGFVDVQIYARGVAAPDTPQARIGPGDR